MIFYQNTQTCACVCVHMYKTTDHWITLLDKGLCSLHTSGWCYWSNDRTYTKEFFGFSWKACKLRFQMDFFYFKNLIFWWLCYFYGILLIFFLWKLTASISWCQSFHENCCSTYLIIYPENPGRGEVWLYWYLCLPIFHCEGMIYSFPGRDYGIQYLAKDLIELWIFSYPFLVKL